MKHAPLTTPTPEVLTEPRNIARIFVLSAMCFSEFFLVSMVAPFLPQYLAKHHHGGAFMVGAVFAIYPLMVLCFSTLFGWASAKHRIGRNRIAYTGMSFLIVFTFAFGLSTTIWQMLLFRALQGVGSAAVGAASMALVGDWYPLQSNQVMGITESVTGAGFLLGPPIGGWLFHSGGIELPFVVAGSVQVMLLIPMPFLFAKTNSAPVCSAAAASTEKPDQEQQARSSSGDTTAYCNIQTNEDTQALKSTTKPPAQNPSLLCDFPSRRASSSSELTAARHPGRSTVSRFSIQGTDAPAAVAAAAAGSNSESLRPLLAGIQRSSDAKYRSEANNADDRSDVADKRMSLARAIWNGPLLVAMFGAWLGQFSVGAMDPVLAPRLEAEYGIESSTQIGLVFAVPSLAYMFGCLFAALLSRKLGSNSAMAFGAFMEGVGFVLMGPLPMHGLDVESWARQSHTRHLAVLYASCVLGGIGAGFLFVPSIGQMQKSVSHIYKLRPLKCVGPEAEQRVSMTVHDGSRERLGNVKSSAIGVVSGMWVAAMAVGAAVGPLFGSMIVHKFGFATGMSTVGIFSCVMALPMLVCGRGLSGVASVVDEERVASDDTGARV